MVEVIGFEPITFCLQSRRSTVGATPPIKNGLGGKIRTCDFLLPKQAHYQAVLRRDGSGNRTRTCNPRFTKPVLYQLKLPRNKNSIYYRQSHPHNQANIALMIPRVFHGGLCILIVDTHGIAALKCPIKNRSVFLLSGLCFLNYPISLRRCPYAYLSNQWLIDYSANILVCDISFVSNIYGFSFNFLHIV